MENKTQPVILVSGFEAFGGQSINPTQLLIEELRAGHVKTPESWSVETVVLPVDFSNSFKRLQEAIARDRPQIVLALGQAGGRDAVEIERVAINLIDADVPDNKGQQPRDVAIESGQPNALFSTLPLRPAVEALVKAEIPARVSNSAGLYVCNFLFYRLQLEASLKEITKSGFVHLPFLPEQALRGGRTPSETPPSMEFAVMKRALEILLQVVSHL